MDKVVNIAFNSETGDHGILGLKIDFGTYRNNGLYGYTNILFSQALHVNVMTWDILMLENSLLDLAST